MSRAEILQQIGNPIKDRAADAGEAFVDGMWQGFSAKFSYWFTEILDLVAYKSVLFGILLYIMGIKKGGQFSWGVFAVWICLKVVFSFSL